MQNSSTRLSRSDPLSSLSVSPREVVRSLQDRDASVPRLLLPLLLRSRREEVVGSVGHRVGSVLLANSGGRDGRGGGFGGNEELLVGEVEAGGEVNGESSVFGASETERDDSQQRKQGKEKEGEGKVETHRPPRVVPLMNGESQTTSTVVELIPTTTPLRLRGTPAAPESWTMTTRSPSRKT